MAHKLLPTTQFTHSIFTITFFLLLTSKNSQAFSPLRLKNLPLRLASPFQRAFPVHYPIFIGAVTPYNVVEWSGDCFRYNRARLELHNNSRSEYGGGTLYIEVYNAHDVFCEDLYVFVTPYGITWDFYFLSREHYFDFNKWEGKSEYEYVKHKGISIFQFDDMLMHELIPLGDAFDLFTDTKWNLNINFLESKMKANFTERPQPWVTNISADDIHSGDILAISRIQGRRSGFETLGKWVTGSYAGHIAVCLRDLEGKLWVGASGHENEEGQDVIDLLPWDEWWNFKLAEGDADPHIAMLPLHPDLRSKFIGTAAWEYVQSMIGKPYGYHNLFFSWMDSNDENYPFPYTDRDIQGTHADMDLNFSDISNEVEKSGAYMEELFAIPEHDDWVYTEGKPTSCVSFVLQLYKEAGLFDELRSSIQVNEFTIKDAYTLKFFENNSSRLPQWCNDVKLPFCQLMGKYRMELPGYNTIKPYSHMSERCPSLGPEYSRPHYC